MTFLGTCPDFGHLIHSTVAGCPHKKPGFIASKRNANMFINGEAIDSKENSY